MTKVSASSQLSDNTKLWRYMSIDKFIDLLSSRELFFSPLASFAQRDPYEGFLPAVAFKNIAEIVQPVADDITVAVGLAKGPRELGTLPLSTEAELLLHDKVSKFKDAPRLHFSLMAKAIAVSCWHASDFESEALWRIYNENGKGIAIGTTLRELVRSIEQGYSMHHVQIYPIKYLDFFDTQLRLQDCIVENGHRAPLLKRISYQHEREVRAFILRKTPTQQASPSSDYWKPKPIRVPVDVNTLINTIHVSPYASDPFPDSVRALCRSFNLKDSLVQVSRLLSGHEELLDMLSLE